MAHFRFLTAGESHGKGLLVIVEGVPAGIELSEAYIAGHLRRRQMGYGRGKRQQIEADLAGAVKYGLDDLRPVLERASARETTARVAASAIARRMLESLGVVVHSH